MRFRRIAIIIGLSAIIAGGLGGVAHLNKRDPTSDELLLQRHIASVHIHGLSADDAVAQLQKLIGVPIIAKWQVNKNMQFWLDFDDISVDDLLQAFVEQALFNSATSFTAQNHSILIAPHSTLADTMRVYDISDLRKDVPRPTQPLGGEDEIAEGVRFLAEDRYWEGGNRWIRHSNASKDWLHEDSGRLFVLQTPALQMEIAQLLNAVRQARPDGTGPGMWRSRVLGTESTTRFIRFYDVRDLCGPREYLPSILRGSYRYERNATRIESLAQAISIHCSPESWMSAAQMRSMGGRLVVEQTPAVHARIRQMLADIRSGKSVEGFAMTPVAGRAP
ncbi:MAG TPA: hypothetical protein VFE47_02280 [Tepidisphaeraceae bacterium]|jgi:hypothetical protein|nr:hypothetical protein [Tepidisphaeraceae bacterium]